jgi:hypothetical protein
MHLLNSFLVSLYLYTGIANASALGKRGWCLGDPLGGGQASCYNSKGVCDVEPSCHKKAGGIYYTCYCPSGYNLECSDCAGNG